MTWPTITVDTTNLDAGTDSPANARADIKQMADNVNAIKDEFANGDGAKLAAIEASATADQSDAEIKTAYENNADTNAYTDTEKAKLGAIEASANNYTHPSTHSISEVSTLQTALDAKVDDSQVLTNVPAGALFTDTDTVYTHPSTDGNLHVPATSTTNDGKVLTAGSTAGALTWETPSAGGGETCVFEVNATGGGNYGGLETSPYSRTIFSLTDPSSYYSLSGYQITLPAGSYTLEHFQTVIDATDSHTFQTQLYNVTTSTVIASSEGYNEIGTQGEGLYAFSAIFTLATSTAIEIRGNGNYYIPTQRFKLTHIA